VFPISPFIQASGSVAVNGWAKSPAVEGEIAAWFNANTPDDERVAARRLNEVALNEVVCAPLGWYLRHSAWTKNLTGVSQGPFPFFWGVSKSS